MRDLIRQYLLYTRSQRRAVIALVVLILGVLVGIRAYHYYIHHQPVAADSALQREVAEAMIAPTEKVADTDEAAAPDEEVADISKNEKGLFYFDPNTIGIADWLRLGLSEKQANGIERYKAKGGTFRAAVDLNRLYSLTDSDKARLIPYVRITAAGVQQREATTRQHQTPIEINTADSAAWESLWGIGPVLSVRIIRYREALGGFYSVDQVAEVRGISDTVYAAIRPRLTVNVTLIHKLSLNTSDYETLRRHPYIHARIAKGITGYRERQGDFQRIEQLKELNTVTPEMYDRLVPYLGL
ncbi:MAG: helix-hairpin-helix domain-containing protein [Bacteroidetes bacterium]|nr:helix-hairpin-helix domain-containing protein [Bacteroidota bacterium]